MFVYMIINDVNGKYYIGKTISKNLRAYLKNKLWRATTNQNGNPHLNAAIRKYGAENFRIHPLMSTLKTDEEICRWERELIAMFKAQDSEVGYNIADGGEGGFPSLFGEENGFFGKVHSEETKELFKQKALSRHAERRLAGIPHAPNKGMRLPHRDNSGSKNPMFGKRQSEATKQLIREKRYAHLARVKETQVNAI